MKKFAPIAIIALFGALTLVSCKKKWTCECTVTTNGVSVTDSETDTQKRSKKDAKALCEKNNGSFTTAGVTSTWECKLK